jgi:L-ascorbate metabolism protein UlaG (beta-lactamase superfamily)
MELERTATALPRAPAERIGGRYQNLAPTTMPGPLTFLNWSVTRRPGAWAHDRRPSPRRTFAERVGVGEVQATFVNHSTVLWQFDGLNVLTDPIWGEWCGPAPGLGLRRVRAPGVDFRDLPPIDVVLLSHDHFDHLCATTMKRLAQRDQPLVVTALGVGRWLKPMGIQRIVELDWWGRTPLSNGATVHAVPANHFSGRWGWDRDRTLWCGFVIEARAGRLYYVGDSGWGPHFQAIGETFGPMRMSMIPIGAYRPRELMASVHIDPNEAADVHRLVRSQFSIGCHFGTFKLADDGEHEPAHDLAEALRVRHIPAHDFVVPRFGETFELF